MPPRRRELKVSLGPGSVIIKPSGRGDVSKAAQRAIGRASVLTRQVRSLEKVIASRAVDDILKQNNKTIQLELKSTQEGLTQAQIQAASTASLETQLASIENQLATLATQKRALAQNVKLQLTSLEARTRRMARDLTMQLRRGASRTIIATQKGMASRQKQLDKARILQLARSRKQQIENQHASLQQQYGNARMKLALAVSQANTIPSLERRISTLSKTT